MPSPRSWLMQEQHSPSCRQLLSPHAQPSHKQKLKGYFILFLNFYLFIKCRATFFTTWDWHAIIKFIFPLEREGNHPFCIIFMCKALDI